MSDNQRQIAQKNVKVTNPGGASPIVLVCEHAAHHVPDTLNGLGLSAEDAKSHAAWDPGALGVALRLSQRLDAVLVAATVSRLVYDCNRPPDAPGAMAARSERIVVPGNAELTPEARQARVDAFYIPFRDGLARTLAAHENPAIVTVHSFTPTYDGRARAVEIGVLHDADTRMADALLASADRHTRHTVERNAPYGPEDGVTHTLRLHGLNQGRANVMLEVRNDLIDTPDTQVAMADMIAPWLVAAYARAGLSGEVTCTA